MERIYARPNLGASQPKRQEEAIADQAEKATAQPKCDLLGHLKKWPAHISILPIMERQGGGEEEDIHRDFSRL